MLDACQQASYCIGTDASYKGQCVACLAVIVQRSQQTILEHACPCSANSSFDGELQALCDTLEYVTSMLCGRVLVIGDNEAALQALIDNSWHSGFPISLRICQLLKHWFISSPSNLLQFRWFPGHMGLELNELADALAGTPLPCVHPPLVSTLASSHGQSGLRLAG